MKKLKLDIQRFASTNKTTHYELSQYIGTDKPTYLVDYNQDMSKIDTGIYSADAKAVVNATNIGDLSELTTTDKLNLVNAINEVNSESSTIGDLQDLTTTDKSSVVNAVNEVNGKANTIGNIVNLTTTDKTSIVNAVNEVNAKANNNTSAITTIQSDITTMQSDITTMQSNISSNTTKINGLGGQILWANPNPTTPFSTLTINLSSSDYDMYMILFENNTSGAMINNSVSLKGYGTQLIDSIGSTTIRRLVDYVSDTKLNVKDATGDYSSTSSAIPLYVIGYKTNLFN